MREKAKNGEKQKIIIRGQSPAIFFGSRRFYFIIFLAFFPRCGTLSQTTYDVLSRVIQYHDVL